MKSENTGIFISVLSEEKKEKRRQDWNEFFSRIETTCNSNDEGISVKFDSLLSDENISDDYTSTSTQRPTKKTHKRKKVNRSNKWRLLCKTYSLRLHNVPNEEEDLKQEIASSNEKSTFKNNIEDEERIHFKSTENLINDKLYKESQLDTDCNDKINNITDNFSNVDEIINEPTKTFQNTSPSSHERTIINSTNKRKATEIPATNERKKIRLKTLYFYSDDIKDKQAEYTGNSTLISWEDFLNDNF